MLWNAQSINNACKRILLENLLINDKIDVLLLVETFLKPQHEFKINGYTVYRGDRIHQMHGGVAITIRNDITHKSNSPLKTQSIENISIQININNTPTNIIVAYSPKYTQFFENDIKTLTDSNTQFMLFGDFNAKHSSWNCHLHNKAGNILYASQHLMIL